MRIADGFGKYGTDLPGCYARLSGYRAMPKTSANLRTPKSAGAARGLAICSSLSLAQVLCSGEGSGVDLADSDTGLARQVNAFSVFGLGGDDAAAETS